MPVPHPCRASRRRHTLPRGLAALIAAIMLIAPSTAAAGAFTAQLSAPNHTPTANRAWPITVTVNRDGAGLTGSLRYELLLRGALVGTEPWHQFTNGVYHAALRFPKIAVGHALTFQIEVVTA